MLKSPRASWAALAALPLALSAALAGGGERSVTGAREAPASSPAAAAPVPLQLDAAGADLAAALAAPSAAVPNAAAPIAAGLSQAEALAQAPQAAQEAGAEAGASVVFEPGASRVADKGRLGRVLSGAASWLGRRPDADAPPASAAAVQPLAAASPSDGSGKRGDVPPARKLMSSTIVTGLGIQAGFESTQAALPLAIASITGSLSKAADLVIVGALADVLGTIVSPLIIGRLSLRGAYWGMTAAATLMASAVVGAASLSLVPGPLAAMAMMPLLALAYFGFRLFRGAAVGAERNIIPASLQDLPKAEREAILGTYKGRKHVWSEVASVWTQNAVGALITAAGFLPVMMLSPVIYGIVLAVIAVKIVIPPSAEQARRAAAAEGGGRVTVRQRLTQYWAEVSQGARLVFKSPQLRLILGASAVFLIANMLMYGLLASSFGLAMAGGHAQLAAPIAGLMAGLYSFGGLYTGRRLARQEAALLEKYGSDGLAKAEALRRQNVRWLKMAALSMLCVSVMAIPFPAAFTAAPLGSVMSGAAAWLSAALHVKITSSVLLSLTLALGALTAVWRPIVGGLLIAAPVALFFPPAVTLAGAAVFAMGYVHFGATLRTESFYESAVEGRDRSDAIGAIGALSRLSAIPGIVAFKFLFWGTLPFEFKPLPGFEGLKSLAAVGLPMVKTQAPFAVVAAAAVLAGGFLWYVARRLERLTRPAA